MAKLIWLLGAVVAPILALGSVLALVLATPDAGGPAWVVLVPLLTVALLIGLGLTYRRVFPDRWP